MVFQKKKVRTETLSEYLAEIRTQQGLSIEEVSEKSGICVKFLEYLEEGNFQKLPPNVYVMGFLRQLSSIFGVPAESLLEQYKKERGIAVKVASPEDRAGRRKWKIANNFVLTPKLLSLVAAGLFISVTLAYIGVELISVSSAPTLDISEPTQGQLITQSFVRISGQTSPGATLNVNGQNNIFVDDKGNFSTTVPVVSGQPELVLQAQNKFSMVTIKRVPIVVNLDAATAALSSQAQNGLHFDLKLDFTQPVTLGLTVDGVTLPIENEAGGSTKMISAKNEVLVSTTDAGSTIATINSQKLGALGKVGENMTNVPFSAQALTVMANSSAALTKTKSVPN